MNNKFKIQKYAALSHDYGGGDNLYLYLKNKRICLKTSFFFQGPSSLILKKDRVKNSKNLNSLKNFSKVFYSLSWNKNIERFIYKEKKKYKFKTYLILDGWGNYKKKLLFDGKSKNFPDYLVCFDKYSQKLAKKQFNQIKNISMDDYLLKNFIKIKKKLFNSKRNKVLYLTSPLIKRKNIKNIYEYIKKINKNYDVQIRYHPSQIKKNRSIKSILTELINVSKVYGHYSSLLVYSKMLGINAISLNNSKKDIFSWKKIGIFKNYRINEIYDKSFDSFFKRSF